MALTIYEGIRDEDLIDENINEVILRLLGMEDINDLDYETYKTLLRERMVSGRMSNNRIPTSETELLTDEYKRVKRDTGRFKVNKKKVNFSTFTEKVREQNTNKTNDARPLKKLLPSSSSGRIVKREEERESEVDTKKGDSMDFLINVVAPSLSKIESSLSNILENMSSQQKAEEKAVNSARIGSQKAKSKKREEDQEGGKFLGGFANTAKKVFSPLSSIFSAIFKFLSTVLMGFLAIKLLDFLKDPMKIFRNLANSIIDFGNGIISMMYKTVMAPFNLVVLGLNSSLQAFEAVINNTIGKLSGVPELEIPEIPYFEPPKIPRIPEPKDPSSSEEPKSVPTMKGGGEVTNITNKYYQLMEGGGKVRTDSGERVTGAGPDTQLVALQPGEVVMSKNAVDAYGVDTLLGMNAAAGGTNSPKMARVQSASGGGLIPAMSGGGIVEYITGDRSHSGYASDHGGSNYHEHLAFSSTEKRDSAMKYLKSKGITIGSMNDGKHADASYHYTDQAFDIPLYPNIQNFGISDNRKGEEKFSAKVRQLLVEGGFNGAGIKSAGGDKTEVDPQETVTGKPKSSGGGYGTPEQRKMLDAISFAEGTTKSYGTLYGGKVIPELENGQMTVGEVLKMQESKMYKGKKVYGGGYDSNATGKYQFMSYVLREEIAKQGKSMNDLFTPALQDELILNRISRMRGVTPELLAKEGMSDKVIDMLAPEFASFPNLFGPDSKGNVGTNSSYYGQGGKSAASIKRAYGDSSGSTSASNGSTSASKPSIDVGSLEQDQQLKPEYGSSSPPIVSPTNKQITPPPPKRSGGGGMSAIPIPSGGGGGGTSSAQGNSDNVPIFDPVDNRNPELIVVKSIYNIVG
jgi:muramidase (phage lysozyme)